MIELNKIIQGDTLAVLKTFPSDSIDCVITSPPYYGLRDYGTAKWEGGNNKECDHKIPDTEKDPKNPEAGSHISRFNKEFCYKCGAKRIDQQLGLEKTLDEYLDKMLAITSELKRVLKKTGTMFWNHGDSYGGASSYDPSGRQGFAKGKTHTMPKTLGIPEKSLLLQNFRLAQEMTTMVAKRIRLKADRAWLAAMIDGEGCIHIHKRANGRKNATYGIFLSVHNSDKRIIDRIVEITGLGGNIQITTKGRRKKLYRWNALSNNAREVLGDVYPDLVAKQEQARCALYCPSSGVEAQECLENIKALHHDLPTTREYPEPKKEIEERSPFILRNTIIWFKPNCMPSSAKDRFTVDYEPVFFFSKNKKYWFEQSFEPYAPASDVRYRQALRAGKSYNTKEPYRTNTPFAGAAKIKGDSPQYKRGIGSVQSRGEDADGLVVGGTNPSGRVKRSVWKIPTKPYSEAHFATFPPALIQPMVKAGCPEFICKKCGKTREVILEPSEEYKKLLGKGWTSHKTDMQTGMTVTSNKKASVCADYRKTGYTDCGCNAGFVGGVVLDPFMGSGTTALVARSLGRNYIGIELNSKYIELAEKRLSQQLLF